MLDDDLIDSVAKAFLASAIFFLAVEVEEGFYGERLHNLLRSAMSLPNEQHEIPEVRPAKKLRVGFGRSTGLSCGVCRGDLIWKPTYECKFYLGCNNFTECQCPGRGLGGRRSLLEEEIEIDAERSLQNIGAPAPAPTSISCFEKQLTSSPPTRHLASQVKELTPEDLAEMEAQAWSTTYMDLLKLHNISELLRYCEASTNPCRLLKKVEGRSNN